MSVLPVKSSAPPRTTRIKPRQKTKPGEQAAHAEGHYPVGPGEHRRREHGPEPDKCAREDAEDDQAREIHARLLSTDAFGLAGDLDREQRIDAGFYWAGGHSKCRVKWD